MEKIETVIVGGGQAGLATSYWLQQLGREHVILEQSAQAVNTWRNERWDSFTLVTPNWGVRMPGADHNGPDRDGFMSRDELVAYFDRYLERYRFPIMYKTWVMAVEPLPDGAYCVRTTDRTFHARNVVVATGFEQRPKISPLAADIQQEFIQLPSSRYRNSEALPPGAVLVVGSAQSGCQIAEDLYLHDRRVFLSTGGSSGRALRRYRGKDAAEWLLQLGFFDRTPDQLPVPRSHFSAPHLSGANGGHTLNVHQFARDGVTLLGHLRGVDEGKVLFAPDLDANLARIDGFEATFRKMIDSYIHARGIDAPIEEVPQLHDGYEQPSVEELDLAAAGISTIIWAIGFTADYSLIKLPVLDAEGLPIQTCGVSEFPGLYFVGMPWMPSLRSGLLAGVGEFAGKIAHAIADRAVASAPTRSLAGIMTE